jgi:hypothetical protein
MLYGQRAALANKDRHQRIEQLHQEVKAEAKLRAACLELENIFKLDEKERHKQVKDQDLIEAIHILIRENPAKERFILLEKLLVSGPAAYHRIAPANQNNRRFFDLVRLATKVHGQHLPTQRAVHYKDIAWQHNYHLLSKAMPEADSDSKLWEELQRLTYLAGAPPMNWPRQMTDRFLWQRMLDPKQNDWSPETLRREYDRFIEEMTIERFSKHPPDWEKIKKIANINLAAWARDERKRAPQHKRKEFGHIRPAIK